MDRRTTVVVTDLAVHMHGDPTQTILCTASPHLGLIEEEQIEDDQGVGVLTALGDLLRRVEMTGTIRQQFVGTFDTTPAYNTAFLYMVTTSDDILWYKQLPSPRPNTPAGWEGPRNVGSGWADLLAVLPAGGNRFYGVAADGTLLWYQHDGFNDGTSNWTGPRVVGSGWNGFLKIVAGSDGVLYAILPNGTLIWYRHDGVLTGGGADTWRGPSQIGTGWDKFKVIFSVGQGIIYAIDNLGQLTWQHHLGFENGDNDWDRAMFNAGNGWGDFKSVLVRERASFTVCSRTGRYFGSNTINGAQDP
jgi:Tachylectin